MATTVKRKRTVLKTARKKAVPKTKIKKRGVVGLLKGKYKQLVPGDVFNLR